MDTSLWNILLFEEIVIGKMLTRSVTVNRSVCWFLISRICNLAQIQILLREHD